MRSERLRSSVLNKAGMRDKDAFIGLSRGGDLAAKSALEHVKTVGLTGDYYEFGVFRGFLFNYAEKAADHLAMFDMRFFGFDSFAVSPRSREMIARPASSYRATIGQKKSAWRPFSLNDRLIGLEDSSSRGSLTHP